MNTYYVNASNAEDGTLVSVDNEKEINADIANIINIESNKTTSLFFDKKKYSPYINVNCNTDVNYEMFIIVRTDNNKVFVQQFINGDTSIFTGSGVYQPPVYAIGLVVKNNSAKNINVIIS